LSCNLQLHLESICDWPNYWSVQSLPRHPTSSVSCHELLTWRKKRDRVSSCKLRLHFESVCGSPCLFGRLILRQRNAHGVSIETESCCAICNLQLHFESICDWPNYWPVQSLPRHPTSSVSCHELLTWRKKWDRVSSCKLQLHFESVCDGPCLFGRPILRQRIAHGVLIETESCRAIYNCTLMRVSVTGPTTGLSNPCLDTQRLLCLV